MLLVFKMGSRGPECLSWRGPKVWFVPDRRSPIPPEEIKPGRVYYCTEGKTVKKTVFVNVVRDLTPWMEEEVRKFIEELPERLARGDDSWVKPRINFPPEFGMDIRYAWEDVEPQVDHWKSTVHLVWDIFEIGTNPTTGRNVRVSSLYYQRPGVVVEYPKRLARETSLWEAVRRTKVSYHKLAYAVLEKMLPEYITPGDIQEAINRVNSLDLPTQEEVEAYIMERLRQEGLPVPHFESWDKFCFWAISQGYYVKYEETYRPGDEDPWAGFDEGHIPEYHTVVQITLRLDGHRLGPDSGTTFPHPAFLKILNE